MSATIMAVISVVCLYSVSQSAGRHTLNKLLLLFMRRCFCVYQPTGKSMNGFELCLTLKEKIRNDTISGCIYFIL